MYIGGRFVSEGTFSVLGRGIACAIIPVGSVVCSAEWAGAFLGNLYRYGDVTTADLWRRRLLDLSTARAAERAFEKIDPPVFEKFPTKDAFDVWWAETGPKMERVFLGK